MKSFAAYVGGIVFICAATAHAAAPGVSTQSIIVGQSAAFSGTAAPLGEAIRDGANLYFDYVNGNGGVHGRKIRLLSLDDGYGPDRAIANTRQFIDDDGVFALFGYVGTPTNRAVIPMITDAKIPLVAPFAADSGRADEYVFRVQITDAVDTYVEFLLAQDKRRIAVFYRDDALGEAGLAGVQAEMDKHGLSLVATATVDADTLGVEDAASVIAPSDPEAVIIISPLRFADAFMREMDKAGSAPAYLDVATARSDSTFEGFVAAKAFVEGLRRAGRDLTREKFVQALQDRDEDYLRFSTDGEFLPVLGINTAAAR